MTKEELYEQVKRKKSYLCIGLDTDLRKIPKHLLQTEDPIFEFNKAIVESTSDLCIAYKLNLAFYESNGPEGLHSLEKTIRIIPPEIFTIADAKRGDIGNTSELYARAFFDRYGFDAVTVAPYMGKDSVTPFLVDGKWVILLVLTSNAGSMDFQLAEIRSITDGREEKLYEHVLRISQKWVGPDQLMFVVGATHPELLAHIRSLAPNHFFLVPGVGAQGGNLRDVSLAGFNDHCGLLVNSSRQIIYASTGEDFPDRARKEAKILQEEMRQLLDSRF